MTAELTRHQDEVLYVYAEDPDLPLDKAVAQWNRATPGAPVAYIVDDPEQANVIVRTRDLKRFGGLSAGPPRTTGGPRFITIDIDRLASIKGTRVDERTLNATLMHELGHSLGLDHTPAWGDPQSPTGYRIPGIGVMGGGGREEFHTISAWVPNVREMGKVRTRFGYTVNGLSGEPATRAYVRHINRSTAYRARLHRELQPRVNTPSEVRPPTTSDPEPQPTPTKPAPARVRNEGSAQQR